MDLADIRKKARIQSSERLGTFPVQSATALEPDESAGLVERSTDEGRFWEEIGIEQFATEQEYSKGLTNTDGDNEIEQVQWLGFYLGNEEYALDIEVISELIKPRALTELPQVPEYICGIMSLRGEVIPVVDLKIRLGLELNDLGDANLQRIIVCDGKDQRIGLLVDRISQVVRLRVDQIEKPHLVREDSATAFIQGVGRNQGRMLIQLRPEKALEIEEIAGA